MASIQGGNTLSAYGFFSVLVTCVLLSLNLAAQEPAQPPRVVFASSQAEETQRASGEFSRIATQLGDLNVDVVVVPWHQPQRLDDAAEQAQRVSRQHNAAAVVWLDSTPKGVVHLFALRSASGSLFQRDLRLDADPDPTLVTEQLAIVLRSLIPALLQGQPLGPPVLTVHPAPMEKMPPKPAPMPEPGWLLGVGYAGYAIASGTWQNGLLGNVVVDLDLQRWSLRSGFAAAHSTSARLGAAGANALISRDELWLIVGPAWHTTSMALAAEVGVGLDRWQRQTELLRADLVAEPPSATWRSALEAAARADLGILENFGAFVRAGARWYPMTHNLEVESVAEAPTRKLGASLQIGITVGSGI